MEEWPRFDALHVAHHRVRYGDVSIEESLEMLRTGRLNDEQAEVLADRFGALVEVLKAQGGSRWRFSRRRRNH